HDRGGAPTDPYHTGFAAYRWLCRRLRPVIWLHGHTSTAARSHRTDQLGPTTLVNVTGATLIELDPGGDR
ncbi:MAG TPA: metallophosphoesterase, partial [Candidatus Limnocylindria bacterium]|nr:metallophosphoesterase [Candidatus Limnocylindria bacterium]